MKGVVLSAPVFVLRYRQGDRHPLAGATNTMWSGVHRMRAL